MAVLIINSTPPLSSTKRPISSTKPTQLLFSNQPILANHQYPPPLLNNTSRRNSHNPIDYCLPKNEAISSIVGTGIVLSLVTSFASGEASAAEIPLLGLQLNEPDNALSLPTWAIHVSSVVEW